MHSIQSTHGKAPGQHWDNINTRTFSLLAGLAGRLPACLLLLTLTPLQFVSYACRQPSKSTHQTPALQTLGHQLQLAPACPSPDGCACCCCCCACCADAWLGCCAGSGSLRCSSTTTAVILSQPTPRASCTKWHVYSDGAYEDSGCPTMQNLRRRCQQQRAITAGPYPSLALLAHVHCRPHA